MAPPSAAPRRRGRTPRPAAQLLSRGLRRLVLHDAGAHAHHLGERPVGDTLAVGEAPAAVPPDLLGQAVDVLEELPGQPRLADAGEADDREQPRPRPRRVAWTNSLSKRSSRSRPTKGGSRPVGRSAPPRAATTRGGPPEPHRLRFALQLVGPGVVVVDRGLGRPAGALADVDGPGLCHRLHPGRRVHQVTGDHALVGGAEVDRRLTGETPARACRPGSPHLPHRRPPPRRRVRALLGPPAPRRSRGRRRHPTPP